MHEFSIVKSLLDIIFDECKKNNIKNRVEKVNVIIGKLNWIYPEIFEESFIIQSKSTIAEGAQLNIIDKPALIKCKNCSKTTELTEPIFVCEHCMSSEVEIISGQELYLESFEVTK